MISLHAKPRFVFFFLLSAVSVFIYLLLRAYSIPPVHDEAATFFHYINHGEFLPGKALWDANNHILNSFLGKFCVKVFGVNTFSIRLPNLLFFPVYAFFLYAFCIQLKHEFSKYVLALTGLFMHGFVEYFAYSRGYGMSMALLTGALYFSYLFFNQKRARFFLLAYAFYWLGTLSNLTLQNTALLFLGTCFVFLFVSPFSKKQRLLFLTGIFIGLIALSPFIRLSLLMKRDGLLYYAADEDFWTAIIVSFTQQFFDSTLLLIQLFWFVWTGLFIFLIIISYSNRKKIWETDKASLFFPLLFFGNVFGIIGMHYVLGVNYPSDRTGMHLVLYFVLGSIFFADLSGKKTMYLPLFPCLIFVVQFITGANLQYSTYWKGEHLPERFWQRINEESASGKFITNPTLGGYKIRNLVWAWYNFKNGGTLQNMQYDHYYTGFEDYQFFLLKDFDSERYDSLDVDAISGVILARRKHFLQINPAYIDSSVNTPMLNFNGEYYNVFETFACDSFIGKSWLVEAQIKLYSLATPPKIRFVCSFHDSEGNTLDYQTSPLHWLKKEFRPEDSSITVKRWWYEVPPETKRIVIYLWNINKEAYSLESTHVKISSVQPE